MAATDQAYRNARRLRRELSLPEVLIWARLKRHPLRLRRQHPIGPYILDFYYASARLAIEIDGAAHGMEGRQHRDAVRDNWLAGQGVEVLRIPATDVLADPDAIADAIILACTDRGKPLHRSASPSGPPPHGFAAGRSE